MSRFRHLDQELNFNHQGVVSRLALAAGISSITRFIPSPLYEKF
jgi:hypothetical protein